MSYLAIPLAAVASQTVTITIADQRIRLNVYQKAFGLFVDVYVNDAVILSGALARNLVKIVRSAYLGFIGDLFFFDTQGESDPTYDGLADRFVLLYSSG